MIAALEREAAAPRRQPSPNQGEAEALAASA
jgi:hypothetical protein